MATFKVTFTLDESDANYFRAIYRKLNIRSQAELVAVVRESSVG